MGLPPEQERITPFINPFDCNSTCNETVWSAGISYTFGIRLPIDRQPFTCNSRCNNAISERQRESVLDYLLGAKPAHASIFFFYDGEESQTPLDDATFAGWVDEEESGRSQFEIGETIFDVVVDYD